MNRNPVKCNPWGWVPSLYFAEGLPYAIVISLSVVMYKELGLSNADATFYTGWFSLPWVFKPLWSPFVDLLKTKRWWIVTMQILMGVGMAGIAFTLPLDGWLQWSLAIFWLMAFSSATHDVAADGFYMMALDDGEQSFFVGIRSTFYRLAALAGESGLMILVGWLFSFCNDQRKAWIITFIVVTIAFASIGLWHAFVLPRPRSDSKRELVASGIFKELIRHLLLFLRRMV